ncbi:MAG: membrane protein insertion efficiency factor YidD [Lachnospiraceae bacterium]|nr:membrane protein insertion efficiency factor YidD [Lachnospiraceae bacterium]
MKKFFIFMIRFYRSYLSPLKSTKCPYFPSCSQYGLEAVEQYGAVKGGLLCIWRILRCNPFSKGGYDPVPSINNYRNYNNKEKKRIKTFYKF